MRSDLDYAQLLKEARAIRLAGTQAALRIALLGDCAVQQLSPLLRALLHRRGIECITYEGAFDASELETLNPESDLYRFRPDIVAIVNAVQALRDRFYSRSGDRETFVEARIRRTTEIWASLAEHRVSRIVQCNYAVPVERFFGNLDLKTPDSLRSIVADINRKITDNARDSTGILLCDVEYIAAWAGGHAWFDERFWTMSKSLCAPSLLPAVAENLAQTIAASMGKVAKCVAVDLDNTLWGGILGDDGPSGIIIDSHGDGEDFYRFQGYLRELKRRGLLLAICSKNDHEKVMRAFAENRHLLLRIDDFAAVVANWDNKGSNLRQIAETLNIGVDSIVFVDDNPFERNLVRSMLPQVIVPEFTDDASEYAIALSETNPFETTSYTAEDSQRSSLYSLEAARQAAMASAGSFTEFLRDLQMVIQVERFLPASVPRISQLFQRSNQFNLTTRRHSEAACEQMMHAADGCIPLTASLKDRFGDHGLISIVVACVERAESTLVLTDWVMSCRVLGRGVEEYLMNRIVSEARARGLDRVRGDYVPTPKNQMVSEFYPRFGFRRLGEGADGRVIWQLDVRDYECRDVFIRADEMQAPHASTQEHIA